MLNCLTCKWYDNGCKLGLKRPDCGAYRKTVEESCQTCEYYLGMGQCRLNLEHECAEDHHSMYTLARDVKRDCETCDSFRNGKCLHGKIFNEHCADYTWWPVVPNWGAKG